ncbi:MAG TPA: HlyD family efflux transporter periplasmic adaptor subunit, partial [Candidatus Acidoferrum sp.]|nr:HlyD family efflux transporter periplasmic adaptor subunit [Candidatus Acidoferrum sp.]
RVLNVALPEIPARVLGDKPPRFPPDVIWKEHIEDGERVVRVVVRGVNSMFRFPPANWELAQFFDGKRSYSEIAESFSEKTNSVLSEDDAREFAQTLEEIGFWHRTAQEKNVLLMQQDANKRRKALKATKSKWGDLAEITFPAFNPDKYLAWLYDHTYWIYTWWFTVLTLALFSVMIAITVTHWGEIGRDTLQFYNFTEKTWGDLGVFWVATLVAMCLHETAHGHATKHYGGNVPAMGFLLIYLAPAFYTDTTEGHVMGSRSQRFVIAMAGSWSELYLCAFATIVWWDTPPDTPVHNAAYILMLITGIAAVLINFNPLIKLDGYYMMSEVLGISELKEDSTAYVSAWVKRNIWDLPVEVPYIPRRRRFGYVFYALLSGVYSYTVLFILARFVGNIFRNFDPDWSFIPEFLTAVFIFRSRIRSLVNFMKLVYLDKRDRVRSWALLRHPLYAIGALILLACLPLWHETITGRFIVEPAHRVFVRALVPGSITQVFAAEGSQVAAGAPLFAMNNLALKSTQGKSAADYAVAGMQATSALLHYADYGSATQERERLAEQSRAANAQAATLDISSPISGTVLTPRVSDRLGSFVSEGTELAEVADLTTMQARMFVSEYDLHRLKLNSPARLVVQGSIHKWDTIVGSISQRSSEIDPELVLSEKLTGLSAPNYYVVDMPLANSESKLRPGMVGTARIYGPRRSLIGLTWVSLRRGVVRKLW